ncbi:MAG: hypothetical protein CUN49_03115 [Candidatus Thermofonsia Clade 1 bacterium]|uniref:DUF4870 domain-containing protein n=1 Tax=Candidatus Thermofonsia Clade 1 bacterium TaxID=2364210 RepID=A0A2M8PH94_9CHLR|nr:MAG: hypothetical protein CUN49_03115 [Candidatus Thermofonsia Clade 1 bacterium]
MHDDMTEPFKPKRGEPLDNYQDVVDLDALIREYGDDLFHHTAQRADDHDSPPKRKNDASAPQWRAQLGDFLRTPYAPGYAPEYVEASASERALAALAHLSLLIGIPLGVSTLGIATLLTIGFPLLIYLLSGKRVPFAAKHALQASLALLVSTLGWVAVTVGVVILSIVLTVLLTLTIVGIVVVPFLWLAALLFCLALLALPFGTLLLSLFGAFQALSGRTFRYPYIGKWTP